MLWECKDKHTWEATFNNVSSKKSWCPKCRIWRQQAKVAKIVGGIFPNCQVLTDYRGFDWLRTKNGPKQHIDVLVPELKLAIEYDGEQHFMPVKFGGVSTERAEENLKKCQRRDRDKNKKIKNNPNDVKYFIRFNYKEKLTEEYIIDKIRKAGVKI